MDRRSFLTGLAATALGAPALGATRPRTLGLPTLSSPSSSTTGGGTAPSGYKVLEIFLVGAASHRDTMWVEGSASSNRGYLSSSATQSAIDWSTEFDGALDGSTYAIGQDQGGESIHLGPCAKALNDAGWLSRVRLAALGHDRPVHPLAQWHGLTGQTFGRSSSAGMGALVEQQYAGQPGLHSWVIPSIVGRAGTSITPALRTYSGAPTAPILLPIGDQRYLDRLGRSNATDGLRARLRSQFTSALQGNNGKVRAIGHDAYEAGAQRLSASQDILQDLSGLSLVRSGSRTRANNESRLAIRAARQLLKNDAKYVCVLDTGAINVFDQHLPADSSTLASVAQTSFRRVTENLSSIFEELVAQDANAIDLNNVLVVIHSDFGRYVQPTEVTNHWSNGYPAMLFGGPVSAPGVVGGMRYESSASEMTTNAFYDDGYTAGSTTPANQNTTALGPSDLRVALLHAAGIDAVQAGHIPTDDLHSSVNQSGTAAQDLADIFFTNS